MNPIIAPFIKYLVKHDLAEFHLVNDLDFFDDAVDFEDYHAVNNVVFENRRRVQKYSFLAKRFGLDLPYEYNVLLWGPFSDELADDFQKMHDDPKELYDSAEPILPESFRSDDFLNFIHGRDIDWVELAATLIYWNDRDCMTKDELVDAIECTTTYEPKLILSVLNDILPAGLLKIKVSQ
jgi:uncharacterized protein YwgA